MESIYNLQKRAETLRRQTNTDSISPEDVGGLQYDTLAYIATMEQNADSLGIRKVYRNRAEMDADTAPVGTNGKPLRYGQLVCIYDSTATEDNGDVYAWQSPGWIRIGHIDGMDKYEHAIQVLKEAAASLEKSIAGLGGSLDLPYRFLPGWDTPRPGDFSDWKLVAQSLDKLNGGSENSNLSGWYRGSVQGVPFDVRVFVRSYIDNEWTQIIAGPVATDHLGRLSIGAQFTILKRNCHNGGWSSWIDDTAAVSTLQNSLAAETKERRDGDNKIQHGIDELEERFSELLPQLSSGVRYVAPAMAPANTIFETKENFLLRELDDGKYTTVRELTLDGKGYIAWSHTVGAGEPAADDSMTLLVIGNDGEPECHTAPLPDSLLELPMAVGENTEKLARIERELNRLLDKTVSALGFSSVGAGLYILDGELNVRTIPPEELAPILT